MSLFLYVLWDLCDLVATLRGKTLYLQNIKFSGPERKTIKFFVISWKVEIWENLQTFKCKPSGEMKTLQIRVHVVVLSLFAQVHLCTEAKAWTESPLHCLKFPFFCIDYPTSVWAGRCLNNGISNTVPITLETPWQPVIWEGTAWLN